MLDCESVLRCLFLSCARVRACLSKTAPAAGPSMHSRMSSGTVAAGAFFCFLGGISDYSTHEIAAAVTYGGPRGVCARRWSPDRCVRAFWCCVLPLSG